MMCGILQIFMVLNMSKVLYENKDLKLIESMSNYVVVANSKVRVVYDLDCVIKRICIDKTEDK